MEQVLLVKSVVKCVLAPDATVDSDAVRAIIDCPVECSWFDGPVVKCCNSEIGIVRQDVVSKENEAVEGFLLGAAAERRLKLD